MPKAARPLAKSVRPGSGANEVKPAPFAYLAATSVEQAVAALASAGGEGKIVAGGQSLMPMLNFRLVKPAVLVDINRIPGLDRIEDTATHLRIGALVRHRTMASHPLVARHLPVLHEAMRHVAHLTVRNRGAAARCRSGHGRAGRVAAPAGARVPGQFPHHRARGRRDGRVRRPAEAGPRCRLEFRRIRPSPR
jgi:hypothetical protein